MNKTGNFSKVQRMVILAVLIALTLVMALTPLGYLKINYTVKASRRSKYFYLFHFLSSSNRENCVIGT